MYTNPPHNELPKYYNFLKLEKIAPFAPKGKLIDFSSPKYFFLKEKKRSFFLGLFSKVSQPGSVSNLLQMNFTPLLRWAPNERSHRANYELEGETGWWGGEIKHRLREGVRGSEIRRRRGRLLPFVSWLLVPCKAPRPPTPYPLGSSQLCSKLNLSFFFHPEGGEQSSCCGSRYSGPAPRGSRPS